MSACCPSCGAPVPVVNGPVNPVPLVPGPQVGTKLAVDPRWVPPVTPYGTVDVHTALTQGLAEYLSTLSRQGPGGNLLRFKATYANWPEPEDKAAYPYATVLGASPGTFDPASGLPQVYAQFPNPNGSQTVLFRAGEFEQQLMVDVEATERGERTALMAMVSEAISMPIAANGQATPDAPIPETGWMFGIRLWLPHYYGAVATYTPIGYSFVDDPDSAMRRERKAVLLVLAKTVNLVRAPMGLGTTDLQISVGTDPISPA